MAPSNKISFRDQVAQEMIDRIEKGTAPWQKPWEPGMVGGTPFNPTTNAPYRGINDLWLSIQPFDDPRWLTFNQAKAAGASVRKGSKATSIEYWQWTKQVPALDDNGNQLFDEDGKKLHRTLRLERPNVFYAKVFNAEQIEGLEPYVAPEPKFDPIERAEQILAGANVPIFHDQADRAVYKVNLDEVHLPPVAAFKAPAEYYSTALDELGHATGHESRLDRQFGSVRGTEEYAREELRAEISSYMVSRELGIPFQPDQHAAYVGSWVKKLTEDKHEIFRASADAEKIKTWLLEPERRQELERSTQQRRAAELTQPQMSTEQMSPADQEKTMKAQSVGKEEISILINASQLNGLPKGLVTLEEVLNRDHAISGERNYRTTDGQEPEVSSLATTMHELKLSKNEVHKAIQSSENIAGWFNQVANHLSIGKSEELVQLANALEWHNNPMNADVHERVSASEMEMLHEDLSAYAHRTNEHAELLSVVADSYGSKVSFNGYIKPELRSNEIFRTATDGEIIKTWLLEPGKRPDAELAAQMQNSEQLANNMEQAYGTIDDGVGAVAQDSKPQQNQAQQHTNQSTTSEQSPSQPKSNRIYLAVPFAEKNEAKKLGASWDNRPDVKSWYITDNQDRSLFAKWDTKQMVSQQPSASPYQELEDLLKSKGYIINQPLVADGRWHTLPMDGDRRGRKSGSYRFFDDGIPNAQYSDFKTGEIQKWFYTGAALSPEERAKIKAEAAQVKERRAQERKAEQNQAAKRAYGIYVNTVDKASPQNSVYLEAKGVQGYGTRISENGDLVVPVYKANDRLVNVQIVKPTAKLFIENAELIGCAHTITGPDGTGKLSDITPGKGGTIIVCEGKATGDSLYEATGCPVVVAFNANNLKEVTKIVAERFPSHERLIVADNDHKTVINGKLVNVGINKATEAAQETKSLLAIPQFTDREKAQGFTDANDLQISRGKQAVRNLVNNALAKASQRSQNTHPEMAMS